MAQALTLIILYCRLVSSAIFVQLNNVGAGISLHMWFLVLKTSGNTYSRDTAWEHIAILYLMHRLGPFSTIALFRGPNKPNTWHNGGSLIIYLVSKTIGRAVSNHLPSAARGHISKLDLPLTPFATVGRGQKLTEFIWRVPTEVARKYAAGQSASHHVRVEREIHSRLVEVGL